MIRKFIIITDIHGEKHNFDLISKELSESDLIILCGDITNFGEQKMTEDVIANIEKYNKNFIGVIGNCDYPTAELCFTKRCCNASVENIKRYGIKFIGVNGSLATPSNTPNEHDEAYYKKVLREKYLSIKDWPDETILISHQPPFGTLNDKLIHTETHVGSREIRNFIEKVQPLICFTGHIHESMGIDYIGKTPILNPGAFRLGYYASFEIDLTNFSFNFQLHKI